MRKLIVSKEVFCEMLAGIIASGATFEALENAQGNIEISFKGGF
jgi:hypothetical protein